MRLPPERPAGDTKRYGVRLRRKLSTNAPQMTTAAPMARASQGRPALITGAPPVGGRAPGGGVFVGVAVRVGVGVGVEVGVGVGVTVSVGVAVAVTVAIGVAV